VGKLFIVRGYIYILAVPLATDNLRSFAALVPPLSKANLFVYIYGAVQVLIIVSTFHDVRG